MKYYDTMERSVNVKILGKYKYSRTKTKRIKKDKSRSSLNKIWFKFCNDLINGHKLTY